MKQQNKITTTEQLLAEIEKSIKSMHPANDVDADYAITKEWRRGSEDTRAGVLMILESYKAVI